MSRFTHRLKEPFGKAGLTVAILALVMALVGGAYAAGGLTKSQEKQVTKIAKKYAGKPGATGPAGTNGTNGTNGTPGAAGKNGTNGTNGAPGSPWTAGGTLPSGSTETGAWAVSLNEGENEFVPISFPIPLVASLAFHSKHEEEEGEGINQVHIILENGEESREEVEEPQTACPGSPAAPQANKGNLCVYVGQAGALGLAALIKLSAFEQGADTAGTVISAFNPGGTVATGRGTWAVTAP